LFLRITEMSFNGKHCDGTALPANVRFDASARGIPDLCGSAKIEAAECKGGKAEPSRNGSSLPVRCCCDYRGGNATAIVLKAPRQNLTKVPNGLPGSF
jgi:hypothetical protein